MPGKYSKTNAVAKGPYQVTEKLPHNKIKVKNKCTEKLPHNKIKVKNKCGKGDIGSDKPIAYASRTLSDTEVKYSTIEKELLAIMFATKQFRPYLWGTRFTLITDHKPLIWLHNIKDTNAKLERCKIKLHEFDYDVVHKPDSPSFIGSRLDPFTKKSRLEINHLTNEPDNSEIAHRSSEVGSIHSQRNDRRNSIPISDSPINTQNYQVFLEVHAHELQVDKRMIQGKTVYQVRLNKQSLTNNLISFIKNHLLNKSDEIYKTLCHILIEHFNDRLQLIRCTKLVKVVDDENMQKSLVKRFHEKGKHRGITETFKLVKVVDDENMQKSLVKRFHEKGNHRGITETFNALRREYFWNNYHNDVIKFINACHLCQINKYDRKPINLPMQVTNPVSKPMQMLRADVFKIKNNVYLTILDSFNKIPINSQLLAEYKESIQKINDDLAQVKQKHKMKVINKQNEKRVDKGLNIGSQDKMKVINKQNEKRVDKGLNIGSQVYIKFPGSQVYIKFPGKYSKTNAVAKGPYQVTEMLPHNKIKVKNKCGKVFEYHIDSIKSIVTGTCAPSDAPAQN
ncbi:Integrase zinc binding domain [Popillia japonica]|uniref:RNA-directed DNA polymerase n=1 Tax=Popillia japonica TaxID=7064 RepID=A0AAW1N9D6_POPJA